MSKADIKTNCPSCGKRVKLRQISNGQCKKCRSPTHIPDVSDILERRWY